MTRAPNLDCRLCGWYGWGGRDALLRHVYSGQCVRRVIARVTEPWLKRLPSQTRSQCAGPVAQPPPAPPEREWLTFGIPMEPVAITDPGPVDLPREAAPHEGAPGIPGYGGGASISGLRWRRVGMASFQEQVQRQLQW